MADPISCRPLHNILFQITLFWVLFVRGESLIDTLCVSGSNLSSQVNGRYEYMYWDSNANASIYYNANISKYLYPISYTKQYIITKNLNDTNTHNATSSCSINTLSPYEYYKQCFQRWISFRDNESFSDSNMRLFDCTDICVTDNFYSWLDGTYVWHSFNSSRDTSVYHCAQCWYNQGTYLFAWHSTSTNAYYWKISNVIGVSAWSYCVFSMGSTGANAVECNSWRTWDGSQWNDDTQLMVEKCKDDPHSTEATVKLEEHDKVCVTGSFLLSLEGEYLYLNNATYYNGETHNYLHRLKSDGYGITNMNNTLKAYCVNDCFDHWLVNINGSWIANPRMRLVNCNEICIQGDNRTWLNGAYSWSHFNYTTNSSVYQCFECTQSGSDNEIYLYGWIFPEGGYNWRIGADFSVPNAWTACKIGYNMGPNYRFEIQDCVRWFTFHLISAQWVVLTDLTAEQCTIRVTDEPTHEPTYSPTESAEDRYQDSYDDCYIHNSKHTEWYGAYNTAIDDDSTANDTINNGKIAGIISWGLTSLEESNYTYQSISNLLFVHTNQTVNVSNDGCPGFMLQHDDDYINGYRVIYTHRAIHGLMFHTMKGNTYQCVADTFIHSIG
eukprot:851900_1